MLEDGDGFRRVAVAHRDPERERLMVELRSKYPFLADAPYGVPARGAHRAIRDGERKRWTSGWWPPHGTMSIFG